jgi:hypothetical protein
MTKKTLTIASVLLLLASVALAQNYLIPWSSINAGGLPGASTNYGLNGTLAQKVQGTGTSTNYAGYWGFWYGVGRVRTHDVGVNVISVPADSIYMTGIIPASQVEEFGDALDDTFQTFFEIFDSVATLIYSDSVPIVLDSGSTDLATFKSWTPPISGNYAAMSKTVNKYDANHANDSVYKPFFVRATPPELGWVRKADMPVGPKSKYVKDGGAVTYLPGTTDVTDSGHVYGFKGNSRYEFYRYNTMTNTWAAQESIPAIGRAGKKKAVKKGASLTSLDGKVYATKGNSTYEFWCFRPDTTTGKHWSQLADVPTGAKAIKEGSGMVGARFHDTSYVYLLKGSSTQEAYRYNTIDNTWATLPTAPLGVSGKAFKDGSALALGEGNKIYAVKGTYNEFYSFNLDSNKWFTLLPLPLIGSSGKKIKLKSGGSLAYHAGKVYALKGNNKQDFWSYTADSNKWTQLADMPLGGGKRPKGGGAMTFVPVPTPGVFALKGNNTVEAWRYGLAADLAFSVSPAVNAEAGSVIALRGYALAVSPNPFVRSAMVSYSLPRAGSVSLKLYDVTGALVTTLARGFTPSGNYTTHLDASKLVSGIYLLKMATDDYTTTTKLIIE